MMLIRKYQPTDIHALAELMGELGYPSSSDVMQKRMERIEVNPYYHTFVATWHDKVVGMAGINTILNYESDSLVTHILALVTHKDYQGRGIGKQLIGYVDDWAVSNGSAILYLTSGIKPERGPAHKFYKQLGFEITGYRFIKKSGMRRD